MTYFHHNCCDQERVRGLVNITLTSTRITLFLKTKVHSLLTSELFFYITFLLHIIKPRVCMNGSLQSTFSFDKSLRLFC